MTTDLCRLEWSQWIT